ncbi:uncharacterized protein LOC130759640 isoform X2 [Actinidia eriantha]|uniref:uncharacterized protein LOC130759640 isoform X2 n=1 Tax=Actinidia eriantha TaxID=165200 RepID=UPI002587B638|nr:uncharacterized protein LOC130759640 isoform X2 [Actinidia eriantha]
MVGRVDGLNLTGRRMRTWMGSGIILLVNGMEILMIKVCACAWSPAGSIASGSRDSTARIWTIADATSRSSLQNGHSSVIVLKHVKGKTNEKNKDVTTLDWNLLIADSLKIGMTKNTFLILKIRSQRGMMTSQRRYQILVPRSLKTGMMRKMASGHPQQQLIMPVCQKGNV